MTAEGTPPLKPSMPALPDNASPEERRARAAALQSELLAGFRAKAAGTPRAKRPVGDTLAGPLDPAARAILAGLSLHARRYGLAHASRTAFRKMGCRDLAAVAETPHQRAVDWLGNREAEAVAARMEAIVAEAVAGKPEPGVTRMAEGLDDETMAWLSSRPVEDVAGRGIPRKVALALREVGHGTLGALARVEADEIEDIHGIGAATVVSLRSRLAGIVAEGADAPARKRRRRTSAEDAEWDAAAPDGGI